MKKLIVVTALLIASVLPVSAETVETCNTTQYGGSVCGTTTVNTTVEHKVIETGASDSQMIKLLLSLAGAAAVATGLYKLTYKSYILG